jgi:hypothetical protein
MRSDATPQALVPCHAGGAGEAKQSYHSNNTVLQHSNIHAALRIRFPDALQSTDNARRAVSCDGNRQSLGLFPPPRGLGFRV